MHPRRACSRSAKESFGSVFAVFNIVPKRLTHSNMRIVISLITCLLAGHSFAEIRQPLVLGAQDAPYRTGDPHNPFSGEALSPEKLRRIVEDDKNDIHEMSDLLEYLRNHGQEGFLKNFASMTHSESNHGDITSSLAPRQLSFKDRMILAVPTDSRGQTLEFFDFDPKYFDFSRGVITFSPPKGKPQINIFSHEKSYKTCTSCHGSAAQPLWSGYPLWPGAAFDETFFGFSAARGTKATQPEFVKRIAEIGKPNDESERRLKAFNWSNLDPHNSREFLEGQGENFHFYIQALNNKRIVHHILEMPRYELHRYAVLGAALNCPNIEDFFSEGEKRVRGEKFESLNKYKNPYLAILANTLQINDEDQNRRLQKMKSLYDINVENVDRVKELGSLTLAMADDPLSEGYRKNSYLLGAEPVIAKLRYVIEGNGIFMRDWALSRSPDKDSFSYILFGGEARIGKINVGGHEGYFLRNELGPSFFDNEKTLTLDIPFKDRSYPETYKSIDQILSYSVPRKICDALRKKSRELWERVSGTNLEKENKASHY